MYRYGTISCTHWWVGEVSMGDSLPLIAWKSSMKIIGLIIINHIINPVIFIIVIKTVIWILNYVQVWHHIVHTLVGGGGQHGGFTALDCLKIKQGDAGKLGKSPSFQFCQKKLRGFYMSFMIFRVFEPQSWKGQKQLWRAWSHQWWSGMDPAV